jgi:hypothetical protein
MYRRPKFLEVLLEIRREMAHEADYDVDLYAEMVRSGRKPGKVKLHSLGTNGAELNGGNADQPLVESQRSRRTRAR